MSRAAALLAAAVGALCAALAAPGLTWLDAGELAAAGAELGVAHPPGFPVFALIHKAVGLLVPLGDAAFRGNLASALCAAAAAAAVALAARAWGARPGAAVAGAALFALTPGLLLHGTTVEVYAGAALMTALGLWGAAALVGRDGDWRPAAALGFGVGLAAGHHAELRLFVPLLLLLAVTPALRRRAGLGRALALGLALAGLGALVVLYLPIRAAAEPWRNWGDPSTAAALWDHLTGARIRAAFADRFGVLEPAALRLYGEQWLLGAPALALLGLAGCARLLRRPGGWLVPAVWLVDALYATALNPMGLADEQNGLPGLAALGVAAGLAIDAAWSRARPPVAGALAGAAVIAAALWVASRADVYRQDRGLSRVIDRVADTLPPEALVLVAGDNLAAGLAFRQVVEGTRPDLAVIVRQHVGYASSVGPVARRLPAALTGWAPGAGLSALARLGDGWPVAWEWASGLDGAVRPAGLAPRSPLFVRPLVAPEPVEAGVPDDAARLGRQGRRARAIWLSDRGRFELARGDAAAAARAFEQALALEPEDAGRWNNAATALAALGRHREAQTAAAQAVALDPDDPTARLNLARYALHAGDAALARATLDALIAEESSADALALRGVLRGNAGDLAGAAADFEAALALDPAQPEARAGVETLRRMRAP